MKVLTFSRTYPSYHPKAGQPTYFIEKVVGGLVANDVEGCTTELIKSLRDSKLLSVSVMNELSNQTYGYYKHHTIRAGHRFKAGDWFSPRVWSGKPYNSKQITFAPDIQVKKTFDVIIDEDGCFHIDGKLYAYSNSDFALQPLAKNDGLEMGDMLEWFYGSPDYQKKGMFEGQIICWNENIEY
jgi:hypothetical protein